MAKKKQRRNFLPREVWETYEKRKRILQYATLSADEYERRIQKLCEELGI